MTDAVTVFIDGRPVSVPANASLFDALRLWDPEIARSVEAGSSMITDSRGLPAEPESPAYGGAILRVIPSRRRDSTGDMLH